MIIRKKEMKTQVRSQLKGGAGDVSILHLVDCSDQKNIRFLGEMTLSQGASIGNHKHENETEYYIIIGGIGVVSENGEDHKVVKGDVIVTGNGSSHAIRNGGHTPLKILAFIVT